MSFATVLPIVVGLFLAMVACLELGYRAGRRRMRVDSAAHEGLGSIEAATFALLGLLLGFAFSGALGRFDARRGLIIEEANAIGTAYLRLDLAPLEDQPGLRHLFREYLDARIGVYATPAEDAARQQSIAAATAGRSVPPARSASRPANSGPVIPPSNAACAPAAVSR